MFGIVGRPAPRIGWECRDQDRACQPRAIVPAPAFPHIARLVEGEVLMYRIETIVLVGLCALLVPFILVLTLY